MLAFSSIVFSLVAAMPAPAGMPEDLLRVDVSSALDAAQARALAERGYEGLVLAGACSGLSAPIDVETLGARLAPLVDAARAAGLRALFIEAPLAPERNWFTGTQARAEAVAAMGRVAALAARLELRGVAIDTRATSLFYAAHWDGFDFTTHDVDRLHAAAEDFGRALLRAVAEANPNLDCLLYADAPLEAGPYWLSLFRGACDGLARAGEGALEVIVPVSPGNGPVRWPTHIEQLSILLDFHAQPATAWPKRGGVSIALAPQADDWSLQLATAHLSVSRYVWVDGASASHTPPEEAPSARSPLDAYTRVGRLGQDATRAYVLRNAIGNAALFTARAPEDLPVFAAGDRTKWTNLATGTPREATPASIPAEASKPETLWLAEGLPAKDWVNPACFWLERGTPSPDATGLPLRFGFVNRTGFSLAGRFDAMTPPPLGIRPEGAEVSLEPGEGISLEGEVRGPLSAGREFEVSLLFTPRGATPFGRAFPVATPPIQTWALRLAGPADGPPTILRIGAQGERGVLVCSSAGDLRLLDENGAPLWTRYIVGAPIAPVQTVLGAGGETLLVLADRRGRVYALDKAGQPRWQARPGEGIGPEGLLSAEMHPYPGSEIVARDAAGAVAMLLADGQVQWRSEAGTRAEFLLPIDGDEDGYAETMAFLQPGPEGIRCYNRDGAVRYAAPLEARLACGPVTLLREDGAPAVAALLEGGRLLLLDPATGHARAEAVIDVARGGRFLVAAELSPATGHVLLIGTEADLVCLGADFALRWASPVAPGAPPNIASSASPVQILVPTKRATLLGLSAQGERLWETPQAGAAVTAAVPFADSQGATRCVYLSADHFARCILLPKIAP